MKKFSAIILCMLFCFTIVGCSADSIDTKKGASKNSTSVIVAGTVNAESKKNKKSKAELTINSKNDVNRDKNGKSEKTTKTSKKTTLKERSAKKNTTTKSAKKTTLKEQSVKKNTTTKKSDSTKVNKPNETTTKKAESSTIHCSISIDCSVILSNMDKLKAGHEAYIGDGVILNKTSLDVKKGVTVYDVLKKACAEKGISINVVNSPYGKYIAGINNIDEKDCGKYSGWTYTVNDSYPNKSVDKYLLKNGDIIKFIYTC